MSLPRIFVFCNTMNCHEGAGDWHSMVALAEDGTGLAGHICSSHGWAAHDMGINPDGWKRDLYAAHYPAGFEVVWVEDPRPGKNLALDAAYARCQAARPSEAPTPACPRCKGSGKHDSPSYALDDNCPSCGGSGYASAPTPGSEAAPADPQTREETP